MTATNSGYAGVRITSGTNGVASGKRVNFPVAASTSPSRRYPSWSLQETTQSLLWYQMNSSAWTMATTHTIHSERRAGIVEILVQQFAIQRLDVVDQTIEAVAKRHRLPSGVADPAARRGIGEQGDDMIGKRAGVAERREQADRVAVDDISDAADVGADAWHGGGEAFDECHWRAFVARCEQEDVARGVERVEVSTPAEEAHAIADAAGAGLRLERVAEFAVAGDHEDGARDAFGDQLRRLEEEIVALDGGQPSSRRDHVGVWRERQRFACRAPLGVADRGHAPQVETERNHPVLIWASDVVVGNQFTLDARRDGNQDRKR